MAASLLALAIGSAGCRTTQSPGTQIDDSWITTKVNSKLAASPEVSMMNVAVQTDEGIVTLTGRVDDDASRRRAVQLARETEGVKSVRDLLKVGSTR
jgi:hyperosmotically inducible protein